MSANSTVRVVVGASHIGPVPMTDIHQSLSIESVTRIRDRCLAFFAWSAAPRWDFSGCVTRRHCGGKIPLPDLRGWSGSITENMAKVMWNKLPENLKTINEKEIAKNAIKSWTTGL